MVSDLNHPDINIYNHLLRKNKKKRIQENNPQHKNKICQQKSTEPFLHIHLVHQDMIIQFQDI
jgi:hypothetical protein